MNGKQIRAHLIKHGKLLSVWEHETLTKFHNFAKASMVRIGEFTPNQKLDSWVADYLDSTESDADVYAGGVRG